MSTIQEGQPHYGKTRRLSVHRLRGDPEVSVREDESYHARLEVTYSGVTYRYGVDVDRRATFLDARNEDGRRVDVAEPAWMYSVFNRLGIRDR